MLEVKLKDITDEKVIKDVGELQFWRDTVTNEKIITIRVERDLLHAYHFQGDKSASDGIFNTCGVDDFVKTWLAGSYEECTALWELKRNMIFDDIFSLQGTKYWKTKDGDLYMSMWSTLYDIEPTLIPMNRAKSAAVSYTNVRDMINAMKRLSLYRVENMRLEEL